MDMDLSLRGVFLTSVFHIIILLLLIFFGFSYPDPPPEEEGILVNFGTSETGLGQTEPKGDEFQGGEEQTPEITRVSTPVPAQKPSVKEQTTSQIVQDIQESPVKEKKPTEEELKQQQLERQRQEELKKQREEEEKKKQKAEKIQNLGKSAFGTAGVGTTEGAEGVTSGTGNQGSVGGTPDAGSYTDGGGLGSGISYGLGDRKAIGKLPEPLLAGCIVTSKIVIRVQINVDPEGNVVGEPRILDSTFQDDCIDQAVIKAATRAKFNADPKAAFRQQGWIRYIIEP